MGSIRIVRSRVMLIVNCVWWSILLVFIGARYFTVAEVVFYTKFAFGTLGWLLIVWFLGGVLRGYEIVEIKPAAEE